MCGEHKALKLDIKKMNDKIDKLDDKFDEKLDKLDSKFENTMNKVMDKITNIHIDLKENYVKDEKLSNFKKTVEEKYASKVTEKVVFGLVGAILLYVVGKLLGMIG